uniref:pleckstrin homology domain-containing family D member 1-like n=1 Tax=Styela clava TaxID=7725 RepID=UPI0019393926|nr:pleckstrin homology domain-containing family D member 1-like [Styela clava]
MEISWFKSRRESGMSNTTVDSGYGGSVGSNNGNISGSEGSAGVVQMSGVMMKKPFGHQSTKWSRRFFILKEGYLLYYAESEKKIFDTKKIFNIHPKGVIPLGNCTIENVTLPGMPHCINISHPELKLQVRVAADDEETRKMWLRAMDRATKVTVENSGLSETMIKSLQEQSLQLARERQEYVDKFINEAEELGAERELREALEEFNQELEEENARIEGMVEELQDAHNQVKNELLKAIESSKALEKEREIMRSTTEDLQKSLEALSSERAAIIQKLQDHEAKAEMPAERNAELARQLAAIEQKAISLEKDKEAIRLKLEENQRMSTDILKEREAISLEAEELKSEMQNLSVEKKIAEKELKEEIVARMELQRELEECKAALKRLEEKALSNAQLAGKPTQNGVENHGTDTNPASNKSTIEQQKEAAESNEQILRDVKSLRAFFENCARENTIEDMPVPAARRSTTSGTVKDNPTESSETEKQTPVPEKSAAAKAYARASIMRRRVQSTRCKSMVLGEEFTLAPLSREQSTRRSALLAARHKRSLSLSGKKKSEAARMNVA